MCEHSNDIQKPEIVLEGSSGDVTHICFSRIIIKKAEKLQTTAQLSFHS